MFQISLYFVLALSVGPCLDAQALTGFEDAVRVGTGVTAPHLLHKTEPQYSPDARADHIQGTVVLQIVINEKGRVSGMSVISPVGFGLDERAQAAVETWEFAPGMKDGKPVKVLATVEVNFRFPQIWFDEKAEHQRTTFNLALEILKRTNPSTKAIDHAVQSLQDLTKQRFPPAMYLVGIWEIAGERLTRDPQDGLAQIQRAAAKNYGPALYEIAIRQIEGRDVAKDIETGKETMRRASLLGSAQAQMYLGNQYESGSGVPRDAERARHYFRLCGAKGVAVCQYRLGRLLLDAADRPERDYVQAVAWFQLAGEHGIPEAKDMASKETAKMTPDQTAWMTALKAQLVRK